MTAAAEDEARNRAGRLGLQPGLTVQELGYDDDVDDQLRAGVEAISTERGKVTLPPYSMLVAHPREGAPKSTGNQPARRPPSQNPRR